MSGETSWCCSRCLDGKAMSQLWTYIRQFQFRRMNTDAYNALAKLCSAANC